MNPEIIRWSAKDLNLLRQKFDSLPEASPFHDDPKFAARVASYGIAREVGTVNDELARFIFDADRSEPIRRESLQAELVEWNGLFGVHVFSTESSRLDLRTRGFFDVVHPKLSRNDDGSYHSLYLFPEIIAKIAALEGVELVLVKSWGRNSIFGGFDPRKEYYQTNFWELENNDVRKFADLTRRGQIAFLGTHDLIAHIAGVNRQHWDLLRQTAQAVFSALDDYFCQVATPSLASRVLPYTIGVVLDDLAQPPSYSSPGHLAVLNELLREMQRGTIAPQTATVLVRFPSQFQKIIELAREPGVHLEPERIRRSVQALAGEILGASLIISSEKDRHSGTPLPPTASP